VYILNSSAWLLTSVVELTVQCRRLIIMMMMMTCFITVLLLLLLLVVVVLLGSSSLDRLDQCTAAVQVEGGVSERPVSGVVAGAGPRP